jgi:hypothetical protein
MRLYKLVTQKATLCSSPDLETLVSIEDLSSGRPSLRCLRRITSVFYESSRVLNINDIFQLSIFGKTLVYRHTSGNIDWIIDIERNEYKTLKRILKINLILE